ncbi:hypothetical protein GCM10027055_23580 [Janibacter alkaliphilus]
MQARRDAAVTERVRPVVVATVADRRAEAGVRALGRVAVDPRVIDARMDVLGGAVVIARGAPGDTGQGRTVAARSVGATGRTGAQGRRARAIVRRGVAVSVPRTAVPGWCRSRAVAPSRRSPTTSPVTSSTGRCGSSCAR